ncbi:MAG TPA: SDR family oxidoreductase [Vicinamibacteria bacterium]|nr:SDR family oxidoreductase [Vicinamibacteria bacterium]
MSGTEDLRAVVTGASSGIGAAYARALRARGERVVLVARRADRLAALANELGGEPHALVAPLDLAASGAAEALRRELDGRGIAVDALVNSAGLGHTAAFVGQRPEAVRAMLDLNVRALVELVHAFLPGMRARGRGRIVNVASNAAFQPVPYLAVYAATKSFVLSFSEGLAEELRGTGVRVQALCPGITATEFLEVAGTHPGLLVTRMPMMTPEAVVRASLRGLDRGRVRVVAGWPNRLLGFVVQRLAPRGLARRVAGELYRPREAANRSPS